MGLLSLGVRCLAATGGTSSGRRDGHMVALMLSKLGCARPSARRTGGKEVGRPRRGWECELTRAEQPALVEQFGSMSLQAPSSPESVYVPGFFVASRDVDQSRKLTPSAVGPRSTISTARPPTPPPLPRLPTRGQVSSTTPRSTRGASARRTRSPPASRSRSPFHPST